MIFYTESVGYHVNDHVIRHQRVHAGGQVKSGSESEISSRGSACETSSWRAGTWSGCGSGRGRGTCCGRRGCDACGGEEFGCGCDCGVRRVRGLETLSVAAAPRARWSPAPSRRRCSSPPSHGSRQSLSHPGCVPRPPHLCITYTLNKNGPIKMRRQGLSLHRSS